MPIIFVHGVANRNDSPEYKAGLQSIERYLREYVCAVISPDDPAGVPFIAPYWGGAGAQFAWNRICCPRGSILGMGTESGAELKTALLLAQEDRLRASLSETEPVAATPGILPQGAQREQNLPALNLSALKSEEISDLTTTIINQLGGSESEKARAAIAADHVAHDPAFLEALKLKSSPRDQSELFFQYLQARIAASSVVEGDGGVVGMGAWDRFKDSLAETLSRATSLPGSAATKVLSEARTWLNGFITLFIGDVFTYLSKRGEVSQPGEIPAIILTALRQAKQEQVKRNGEPIIVLTHSMGGQLIYDMVTAFLPAIEQEGIRIDFWCATASQVALFEEMKLFIMSNNKFCADNHNKAPYPSTETLGAWWNVWDANDFISFAARNIFEGVLDESYDSGLSVAEAHGGYLKRPSFYRKLADRIQTSREKGWKF